MLEYFFIILSIFLIIFFIMTIKLLNQKKSQYKSLNYKIPWITKRIFYELSHWSGENLSKENIQKFSNLVLERPDLNISILKIKNKKIKIIFPVNKKRQKRINIIKNHLQGMLNNSEKIKDGIYFFGVGDEWNSYDLIPEGFHGKTPPIFVFASDNMYKYRKYCTLFIDDHTIGSSLLGYRRGWPQIIKEVDNGDKKFPWSKKINKLVWRGLDTDIKENILESPRQKLIGLSKNNSKIIDALFTKTKHFNYIVRKALRSIMLCFNIKPFMSIEDQIRYKILPTLDGCSCTYPGFLWRLYSSSITIKQETSSEQWFYDAIEPWKHYVPVQKDLEDLVEKTEWIIENNEQSEKIAKHSTKFIKENLMPEHINLYIVQILKKYNDICDFSVDDIVF